MSDYQLRVRFKWSSYFPTLWYDETAYVRSVHTFTGFAKPGDVIAAPGSCQIVLDNATQRFSYESGSMVYGSGVGRWVEVAVVRPDDSVDVVWFGRTEKISPSCGENSEKLCVVDCIDDIAVLRREFYTDTYYSSLGVAGGISKLLVKVLPSSSYDVDDDGDSLVGFGESWSAERLSASEIIRRMAQTWYGRFLVNRDGGLRFQGRVSRFVTSGAAALAVTADNAVKEMAVSLDCAQVINDVQVTVHPAETIGAVQEIFRAQTVIKAPAGKTRVFYANFKDSFGVRCAATDVINPVANTDYKLYEFRDGTGGDYTTSSFVSVSFVQEATRLKITVVNNCTGNLYFTLLVVRGKPIQNYDPMTLTAASSYSKTLYQTRSVSYDLPMQADVGFGRVLADYLISAYSGVKFVGESVTIEGDLYGSTVVHGIKMLDKVVLTDAQSGIDGQSHIVRAIECDYTPVKRTSKFYLEWVNSNPRWQIQKVGFGELGVNTRLGL